MAHETRTAIVPRHAIILPLTKRKARKLLAYPGQNCTDADLAGVYEHLAILLSPDGPKGR